MIYINKEEYSQAVDYLQQALNNDPDHLMANFLMGIACKNTGKENQANNYFNAVIARYKTLTNMKSRFAEGYYYIGKCYHYMGDLEKAAENLEKAVEFDTEAVDYHYSFGMLYSDADAFFSLAQVLHESGKTREASDNLKKALELEPNNQKFQQFKSKVGI
jgi:tetratricopeptide (TPR) repeat protein